MTRGTRRSRGTPGRPPGGRVRRRAVAGLLVAVAALLASPARADAHAEPTGSEPESGAQLDAAPRRVLLTFTESVEIGGVDLLRSSGDAVDLDDPYHPGDDGSQVAVDVPALDDGAYVVSWRVTSSDSHPISGALTFAVGDAVATDAGAVLDDVESHAGAAPALGWLFGLDRFVAFAGIVVLVGGAAFLLGVWPDGLGDPRARRVLAVAWWSALVATAVGIALQGAYAVGGGLADALDPSVVGDELGARVGRTWLVRLVVLLAVAALARVASRRRAGHAGRAGRAGRDGPDAEVAYGAALLGAALLGTVSLAGHAASGDLVPLALVTDLVHLAGVSVWLGGLVVLVAVVLRGTGPSDPKDDAGTTDPDPGSGTGPTDPDPGPGGGTAPVVTAPAPAGVDLATLDRVVGRFSSVAFGAVVAIVASGVLQSWRQLGSLSAVVDTAYGRLLVVKVVLVALMVGAAGLSRVWVRRHLAPAAGAPAPAGDTPDTPVAPAVPPSPAGLRRSVAAEVGIAVAVLAVTAGLVQAVPGDRAGAEGAGPAGAGGAYSTEMHGTEVLVQATVDSTATGPTTVEIDAFDHGRTPIDPEEVAATLRLPAQELGPIDLSLTEEGTGEFTSEGAELPFAGEWELVVTVRTSDIDQDRLVTTFTVS